MKYTIPKTFMGKPIEGAIERALTKVTSPPPKGETHNSGQPPSNLINSDRFWTIENVFYRNEIQKVSLLKTYLDNGNSKTQDGWADFSKIAKPKDEHYVGDMQFYHATFDAICHLPESSQKEGIRTFLQKSFIEKYLMTLTRIKYNPVDEDEIIHSYNMPDAFTIKDNFVGPDEWVKDSGNNKNYESFLGTDNLQRINSVYNWITGKDVKLWRVNSKPSNLVERVAWFGAYSDGAGLSCCGDPSYAGSALGVRLLR